ncbi:hypothetical protein D3C81_474520 [compost metagenome]
MHRQEVAFVTQLFDQPQFLGKHIPHFATRPAWPAQRQALLAQFAQPACRGMPLGHQFAWVLVVQFAQVKLAAPGNDQGLGQQVERIQLGQLRLAAQVPFAIGKQKAPGLAHLAMLADGSHAVLQGTATTHVHVHVATGHGADTHISRQCPQPLQAHGIVTAPVQVHGQPQALSEHTAQPRAGSGIATVSGHPQGQQALVVQQQVITKQLVRTLLCPPPGTGDQRAQVLVAGQVLDQQHQLGPVAQLHLAANDQPQLVHLGCLPGAHDTGQRAFVSDCQGLVALLARTPEQLVGARCTALEAEVGKAMQLGITRGVHANQPCSQSGPAWLRSR